MAKVTAFGILIVATIPPCLFAQEAKYRLPKKGEFHDNAFVATWRPKVAVGKDNVLRVDGKATVWRGPKYGSSGDKSSQLRARVAIYSPDDHDRVGQPIRVIYGEVLEDRSGEVLERSIRIVERLEPNAEPYPIVVGLATRGATPAKDDLHDFVTHFLRSE